MFFFGIPYESSQRTHEKKGFTDCKQSNIILINKIIVKSIISKWNVGIISQKILSYDVTVITNRPSHNNTFF